MKTRLALCALLAAALQAACGADFAPVHSWTVEVNSEKPKRHDVNIRRGETLVLQTTWNQDDTAIDLSEATSALLDYTNSDPTADYSQ